VKAATKAVLKPSAAPKTTGKKTPKPKSSSVAKKLIAKPKIKRGTLVDR
jgi:hypothetical protein